MKNYITFVLMLSASFAYAQRENEFQVRVGLGLGVYATENTVAYAVNTPWGPFQFSETTNDGAATVHVPIELRYELIERLNVGLDMKFGSYIYDPEEDNTGKSNGFASFGIAAEFTALNRPNSRIYFGLGINSSGLKSQEVAFDGNNERVVSEAQWRGPGIKINTGFIKYFGDSHIGINLNLGYDAHTFDLKKLSVSNNTQSVNFSNISGTLRTAGFDMALGLVFRLR